jgi:recombination protein RecA
VAKNFPSKYLDAAIVYINENTPNGDRIPLETNLSVNGSGEMKESPTPKRLATVSLTMDKINKDFGAGTIMNFGDRPQKGYKTISTGSISLDAAIGIGGLPRGRMVEIYGPESSGKTTICLHVIANAQKQGLRCLLIDAENSFDPEYAESLGVDCNTILYCQPTFGEEGFEVADRMITAGDIDVVVVDSVAAMVPRGELEGEMGESKMGLHARLMSQVCRKLVGVVAQKEVLMIFINQIRNKIGVMYGSPEVVPGGMALQFFASVRLDVRRKEAIKDGEEVLGNKTRVKVVKNKCAPPMKYAEFDIVYGSGINREGEILDLAVEKGIVTKSGSWYSYGEQKLGQGKDAVVSLLIDNPEMAEEIYRKSLK